MRRRVRQTAAILMAALIVSNVAAAATRTNVAHAAVTSTHKASVVKDGAYIVPIYAYQAYTDTPSMAQEGISDTAKVIVKDKKATMTLSFDSMQHYEYRGYISHITSMQNIVFHGNTPVTYDEVPATVLTTHSVVDRFNLPNSPVSQSAGIKYPNQVQIAASVADEYTWLKVFIPAMDTIARGEQFIRLKVDYDKGVEVPNIFMEQSSLTLTEGTKRALGATITGTTDRAVFTSSNETVATVDKNGMITAVGAGTATIQVTVGEETASCKVTVKKKASLSINKTSATLYTKGSNSFTITATVVGDVTKAAYKTSNAKVATVDQNGKVTAVGPGTATISVTANGITKTCQVTVKKTSLTLNKSKATIYTAGSKTVTLKPAVVGASSKVTYVTSDRKIATVSAAGKVTAVKAGTATITAKANSMTATCKIIVKKPTLTVSKKKLSVKKGKKVKIKATAAPSAKITFTSSNKKVATVSKSGVVKGIKKGTTKIRLCANGVKKRVTITVK